MKPESMYWSIEVTGRLARRSEGLLRTFEESFGPFGETGKHNNQQPVTSNPANNTGQASNKHPRSAGRRSRRCVREFHSIIS